jgi:hypothetical protein
MRADERVLRNFLGVSVIAKQPERRGKNFAPVALHDFDKGRFVAGGETLNQRVVDR